MFIITKETAEAYRNASGRTEAPQGFSKVMPMSGNTVTPTIDTAFQQDLLVGSSDEDKGQGAPTKRQSDAVTWSGEVPPQKWMNFYTKILTKLGVSSGLTLNVRVECKPEGGLSPQKLEEIKGALRELGLDDTIE